MFAYGIILCEIIARIQADPDILPRTEVADSTGSSETKPLHIAPWWLAVVQITNPSRAKSETYLGFKHHRI